MDDFIGNVFKTNPMEFDEVWVVCYAVSELESLFTSYHNVRHVPELAPSPELFKEYRRLVHSGKWDKHSFHEIYVPRFLNDIEASNTSMKKLRELVSLSSEKNIKLVCFCPDDLEQICHRSIVAGLLINMGASIECDEAYSIYCLDTKSTSSSQ